MLIVWKMSMNGGSSSTQKLEGQPHLSPSVICRLVTEGVTASTSQPVLTEYSGDNPSLMDRATLRYMCIRPSLVLPPRTSIRVARYALNLHPIKPSHPISSKRLETRLQLRRMQIEVINSPNPQDTRARKSAAPPVHQVPADRAEAVFHIRSRFYCLILGISRQLVLPADVREALVRDDNIRAEHGRADLVAIGAVADETRHQVLALNGLFPA